MSAFKDCIDYPVPPERAHNTRGPRQRKPNGKLANPDPRRKPRRNGKVYRFDDLMEVAEREMNRRSKL